MIFIVRLSFSHNHLRLGFGVFHKLHSPPDADLQQAQWRINYHRHNKRQLKPNIPRRLGDRTRIPHLRHRRDRNSDPTHAGCDGSQPRGQLARRVPVCQIVQCGVAFSEDEVLFEDNDNKGAGPVADEPEEVA